MQYDTIFFDLDHTLWDFETNSKEALSEIVSTHQLLDKGIPSLENFLKEYFAINEKLWEDYRKNIISKETLRDDRFHQALKKFNIDDIELATAISNDYVKSAPYKTNLFSHAVEVLEYLKEKYSLHIITNGFEETQHLKLKNSKIDHYFDHVITCERSGFKKPDERMFHFSLRHTNAKSDRSIMIGDSLEADVLGAKNVGMHQVYFNPGEKVHEEELTHEVKGLKELMGIL
ncbi:MAG TPA: YjjG family noncanonical pyrimidine nucleotidase [Bacteroidia bacterium]|nr:YjjG family noncanonical pyrimidine nucleotidase [Bacteroidia bacterium]